MRFDPYVNFTAGEISPQLRGRVDIDAYRHACSAMTNFQPMPYGGVRRRFGTELLYSAMSTTKRSRLIPFVLQAGQGFFVELSDLAMTVWPPGVSIGPSYPSLTPFTVATPYTEAQLREIRFAQSGNYMVLVHPSHPPYALSRRTDAVWWFRLAPFNPPPLVPGVTGLALAADLAIASGTGSQAATAGVNTFLAADVGRTVSRGNAIGTITAVASATAATVDVDITFAGETGDWFLGGQPQTSMALAGLFGGGLRAGERVSVTAGVNALRTFNIGDHLLMAGGVVRLESWTSATVMEGMVLREPSSGGATGAFQLLQPAFGATYPAGVVLGGYPSCVAFHDQRLVLGGMPQSPQSFMGSVAGNVVDFTPTGAADDAYNWKVDGGTPILHLVADNDLLLLTGEAEYAVSGQDFGTVTGSDVRIRKQSTDGASAVSPVKVGRENVFVQRSNRTLLALGFDIQIQGYDTHELNLLAEHITESGIVDIAYVRRPVPTVFCVRADGKMACVTLDSKQKVTAWWLWETDGIVEAVATVPLADYDEVWIVVKRTINSATVRYLERIQQTYRPTVASVQSDVTLGYLLDCARRYDRTPSGPTGTINVTTHFLNTVVEVQADGMYGGQHTTNGSGVIAFPYQAYEFIVGLPYTSTLTPMPPEVPTAAGSGQGRSAHATEITVKLHDSIGGTINGQDIKKRDAEAIGQVRRLAANEPNPRDFEEDLIEDDVKVAAQGWKQAQSLVTVVQAEPLPFHVLQIVQKVQANP